ncbi:MAG: DUF1152 domain-containing protein [Zoogloeaceae bacterium]|jgi:hypothetical protein|nr:DUF1152 domain-containing protein [Zoogloeaceae bacterium]
MKIPFTKTIASAKNVLIAGAGGGFDIASGIPLYVWLRGLRKQVTLANLSFTALDITDSEEICRGAYRVTDSPCEVDYFPEKRVLEWLRLRWETPAMYAFSNGMGVIPLRQAYAEIIKRHTIDTLILVDGGTDSLMFGDEVAVGSIVEDACSIVAASGLLVKNSVLAAIGFGVEHNLNHHACLENMATLIRKGYYLGAFSLTDDMPEGEAYLELADYLNETISFHPSIVINAIVSAMQGKFGDYHATQRTRNSDQFVNPFMSLYWFFKLNGVAAQIHFAPEIGKTETMRDVIEKFKQYRATAPRRNAQQIPLK